MDGYTALLCCWQKQQVHGSSFKSASSYNFPWWRRCSCCSRTAVYSLFFWSCFLKIVACPYLLQVIAVFLQTSQMVGCLAHITSVLCLAHVSTDRLSLKHERIFHPSNSFSSFIITSLLLSTPTLFTLRPPSHPGWLSALSSASLPKTSRKWIYKFHMLCSLLSNC